MGRTRYQILRDKKVTNAYCIEFPILEVIKVLRYDNESKLWDKIKTDWTREDWKDFFKIKIDNYGN